MNFINRKSVFSIPSYFIIILFLQLSGCYTQLDTSSLEISKSSNTIQNEPIDTKIIGTWQKTIPWIDGPDQVQQITFYSNGNMLFIDYIGRSCQTSISGSFNTKDSILTIVLQYGYGTEQYYYEVVNEKLTLTPINMDYYFPYKVSGPGSSIWTNPDY